MPPAWNTWLRRLQHDLVKRLLWPARDRKDMGGPVQPGELVVALMNEEGNPATAETIWANLRASAPYPAHPALAVFEPALWLATAAAERNDVAAVMGLEAAFERLVQDLATDLAMDKG